MDVFSEPPLSNLSDAISEPPLSNLSDTISDTISFYKMPIESPSVEANSEDKQSNTIVKRMPRGRPRQFEHKTKQDYHKAYYILHKHKWNMDYQCPSCELVCSYVNKGRHEKSSYHLRILEQKRANSTNTNNTNTSTNTIVEWVSEWMNFCFFS
jgi:hypothetical protein